MRPTRWFYAQKILNNILINNLFEFKNHEKNILLFIQTLTVKITNVELCDLQADSLLTNKRLLVNNESVVNQQIHC